MVTSWNDIQKASGTTYTDIPKPVGSSSTIALLYSGGEPIGLLLSLTKSSIIGTTSIITGIWTNVPKAT